MFRSTNKKNRLKAKRGVSNQKLTFCYLFIVCFLSLGFSSRVQAATEFTSVIDPGNAAGTDYTTLSSWEAANQTDLTIGTTKVFSHGGVTGAIADNDSVAGVTSSATATAVHVTATQIFLKSISGTFQSGEVVQVDGSNTVTLSDAGDSAIAVAKCRSTDGSFDESFIIIGGWTTSATNYVKIWTDPDDSYGRHDGTAEGGGYTLRSTNGSAGNNITIYERYTVIDGIKIVRIAANSAYDTAIYMTTIVDASHSVVKNNLLIQESVASTEAGRELVLVTTSNTENHNFKIFNNIVISQTPDLDRGFNLSFSYINAEVEQSEVYNNTFYGYFDDTAVHINNTNVADDTYGVLFFNNYAVNIHSDTAKMDYSLNGFYSNTSAIFTNNASDDTSAGTSNGNRRVPIADADFSNVSDYDVHINQDSVLKDQGVSELIMTDGDPEGRYYDIDDTARGGVVDIGADEAPVEFASTICEDTSAGGNCANLDYTTLVAWEDAVETDISADNTRVFTGSITGILAENTTVNLCDGVTDQNIDGIVVAHTASGQILIDNITGATTPVIATSGYLWSDEACTSAANYWTVSGTGDELGASARAVAQIDGEWSSPETNYMDISGWTTDDDNYVKIYTTDLARHKGTADTGYQFSGNKDIGGFPAIYVHEEFVRFDGLVIDGNDGDGGVGRNGILLSNLDDDGYVEVKNTIIHDADGPLSGFLTTNTKVESSIFYDIGTAGIVGASSDLDRCKVYNSVFIKAEADVSTNRTGIRYCEAKNNIVMHFGPDDSHRDYLQLAPTSTNNISHDDSGSVGLQNISIDAIKFKDKTFASADFHIEEDSPAVNTGADLGEATDIDGGTRNADELGFDVGADEIATKIYRSVGPTNTTALETGSGNDLTIAGTTATFASAIANNVGVGDVIQYDSSDDGTIDALAFIHGRTDSTHYTVATVSGAAPTATTAADQNWSIFRAYISLYNAESGTENTGIEDTLENFDTWSDGKDIISANQQWNIACYGDAIETVQTTIDGWSTGVDNFIRVYTPVDVSEVGTSQRHNGRWDDSRYNFTNNATGPSQRAIGIYDNYVTIEGLQIRVVDNGFDYGRGIFLYYIDSINNKIVINDNLIKGEITGQYALGVHEADNEARVIASNNIIYDFDGAGAFCFNLVAWNNMAEIYNNTVYNCTYGYHTGGTSIIGKNNLANDCGEYCFSSSGWYAGSTNNLSSDDSAGTDADMAGAIINTTLNFKDKGSKDFHLSSSDVAAIGAGTDLSADTRYPFSDDIDGHLRTSWDIGADEASIEFEPTVMESGGDYSSLATWETGVQTDLAADTTRVFTHGGITGVIADNDNVTGTTSSATAKVVHATSTQILLETISGTFQSGEVVQVDGSNLVTISDAGHPAIAVAKIDGVWNSADSPVLFVGWTTAANNGIKVYTTKTARHQGKWDDRAYRIEHVYTSDWQTAMYTEEEYTWIDGVQVSYDTNGFSGAALGAKGLVAGDNSYKFSNSIVNGNDSGNAINGFGSDTQTFMVWNNIFYDIAGIAINGSYSESMWASNNTIANVGTGISVENTAENIAMNNLFYNTTDPFYGTFDTGTDYNATDNADTPGVGSNNKIDQTFSFVDAANKDFHLTQTDTAARDAGTNAVFTDTKLSLRDDIDGTVRGGAVDIGADEVPVEFISTVMQSGGDYSSLNSWEDAVEADISTDTTRVFTGTITGTLAENATVNLCNGATDLNVDGAVVAHTSTQILIDGITGATNPITITSGYLWSDEDCASAANYWTVSGAGDELGASAIATAKIDGTWSVADTTEFSIWGWTTDHDNYISVYTTDTARHGGVWDDSRYRLEVDSWDTSYAHALKIIEDAVRIEGLQISATNNNNHMYGVTVSSLTLGSDVKISENIIREKRGTTNEMYLMAVSNVANANLEVWNNIFHSDAGTNVLYGFYSYNNAGKIYLENNSFYNVYKSVYFGSQVPATGGTGTARNNIALGCDGGCYVGTSYFSTDSTNNISSDSTADDDNLQNGIVDKSASANYVDISSSLAPDLHLLETADAVNAGADLSSISTLDSSTDIDGGARDADELGFYIGADEVATKMYRSVGNDDSDLKTAASTVTIDATADTATFSAAQPDNVGVGDVIQYGTSPNFNLAFINGRTSDTVYSVQNYLGGHPTAATAGTTVAIYRAHLTLGLWKNQALTGGSLLANASIDATVVEEVEVQRDLVGNNFESIVSCYAADDVSTSSVSVGNWITGERNYLKIYTPFSEGEVGVSQRHSGKWNNNKFFFSYSRPVYLDNNYTIIEGLQLKVTGSDGDGVFSNGPYSSKGQIVRDCIIDGSEALGVIRGIRWVGTMSEVRISNNIIYGFDNAGSTGITTSAYTQDNNTPYVYNNTVYGNDTGIVQDADAIYSNNISVGNTTADFSGTPKAGSDYNLSSDATAYGSNAKQSVTPTFVNVTSNDFHLDPSDTAAINAGTDLSSTISDDIDGHLRTSWDIGADEASIEFAPTVMQSGGDYSSLASWESSVQTDLAVDTTRVFTHGGITGAIADDTSVTGVTSSATATVVHATSTQVLLESISGTFESGEVVQVDGSNLVTISDAGHPAIAVAKIDGTWSAADTDDVTVDGWETGINNYIKIYTTATARHQGKWDNDKYYLEYNTGNNITNYESFLRIDGLQMASINRGFWDRGSTNDGEIYISNSIFNGEMKNSIGSGLIIAYASYHVYNNIAYGYASKGFTDSGGITDVAMYNNTSFGNNDGYSFSGSRTYNFTNNLGSDNTDEDIYFSGGVTKVVNYCLSSDDTASNYSGTGNKINQTVSFIDEENRDLHLASTDLAARNAGTDLSADTNFAFATDIDGDARAGAWDIGADETVTEIYRSVGPGSTTALQIGTGNDLTISGTTATFTVALEDKIGVGDVIQYDSNDDGAVNDIAFISERTDSTHYTIGKADGATPTVTTAADQNWSIFRAYTSLASAEAGTENTGIDDTLENFDTWSGGKDLAASNQQWNIACYGDAIDTDSVSINGWTTGSANYLKLFTPTTLSEVGTSQRHEGVWDDSRYAIVHDASGVDYRAIIRAYPQHIRIEGLQLKHQEDSADYRKGIAYFQADGVEVEMEVSDCLIVSEDPATSGSTYGLAGDSNYEPKGEFKFHNNIMIGFNSGMISYGDSTTEHYWFNNTVIDSSYRGFSGYEGLVYSKNNLTQDCTDGFGGTFQASSDFNISDISGDAPNATFSTEIIEIIFANAEGGDYHLAGIDGAAIGAGTDLGSDYGFDIDGDPRGRWDIGADEFYKATYEVRGNMKFRGNVKVR